MQTKAALFELTPRDRHIIQKLVLGGAAVGGGAALMTQLANYLSTLKQQQKGPSSADDDDTLYVDLPGSPKSASVGTGLAMAGGAISAGAVYAIVQRLMQKMKKRDLQEQLDMAQQAAMPSLPEEQEKLASADGSRLGMGEALLSSPFAAALALLLASGAIAYKGLDSKFGQKPKPLNPAPRRIVYRYGGKATKEVPFEEKAALPDGAAPSGLEEKSEEQEKLASFSIPQNHGEEIVGRLAIALTKEAGDVADIVGAVCSGRLPELEENFAVAGVDSAMALIKGASAALADSPPALKAASIRAVFASPVLAPTALLLAHAETAEAVPYLMEKFASAPGAVREQACDLACVLGAMAYADDISTLETGVEMDKAASATMRELLDGQDDVAYEADEQGVDSGRGSGRSPANVQDKPKDAIDSTLRATDSIRAAAELSRATCD